MELRDYVRALRRDWLLIVLAIALAAGVTFVVTDPAAPTYKASTVLFVTFDPANSDPDSATQRLQSYVALLKGPGIAAAVVAELRLPLSVEQVQEKLDAEVEPGTVLIVLSATDRSPQVAQDVANSAARHLAARVRELQNGRPQASSSPTAPVTVTVAQPAVAAQASGGIARSLTFAVLLGLLLGVAASAARQALFGTIRDEGDARRFAGLETVGVISDRSHAGSVSTRGGHQTDVVLVEAYRKLRTALHMNFSAARTTTDPASLLVTSAVRGEGTTAIACGLAIALAETGSRVVLVDANLREPGVARNLSLNATRGLSDVLTGAATVAEVQREWGNDRLQVIVSGPPVVNPGELLAAPAMAETIRTLERTFDVVVVDAPAVLPVADAVVLGALTKGVLVVVRVGKTRVDRLSRAVDLLNGVGAQVVGAVLNQLPRRRRRPGGALPAAGRPVPVPPLPARPLSDGSGDDSVVLEIGTVRGRAAVPRPAPEGTPPAEPPTAEGWWDKARSNPVAPPNGTLKHRHDTGKKPHD